MSKKTPQKSRPIIISGQVMGRQSEPHIIVDDPMVHPNGIDRSAPEAAAMRSMDRAIDQAFPGGLMRSAPVSDADRAERWAGQRGLYQTEAQLWAGFLVHTGDAQQADELLAEWRQRWAP